MLEQDRNLKTLITMVAIVEKTRTFYVNVLIQDHCMLTYLQKKKFNTNFAKLEVKHPLMEH